MDTVGACISLTVTLQNCYSKPLFLTSKPLAVRTFHAPSVASCLPRCLDIFLCRRKLSPAPSGSLEAVSVLGNTSSRTSFYCISNSLARPSLPSYKFQVQVQSQVPTPFQALFALPSRMEAGESSGAKTNDEPWAKLVSDDSRYPDVEIRSEGMVINSDITHSSPEKHEWCKIKRNLDLCSATLQNLSSGAIIVDATVIGREGTMVINCGSEIISGPQREGYLTYRFEVMPTQELCNRQLKISLDVENAKCSICLNIWHDVVTVAPCLHNFCNGCFSEWLRRCQEKQSNVLCPQCRAVVCYVGRNHFLRNIEEDILQSDSSLKRSSEEVAVLDAQAAIKSNLVIRTGRTRRKRPYSPSNDESIGPVFPCPQCGTEFGGFQCNRTTVHLQCHACGGMMPSRTDISVPQHCLGCDRAFCAAYWQALGVVGSDFHTVCLPTNFKPISQYAISRIPLSAHQNNQFEQDITERCIRQTGKTLQDIISEWIAKLNNREIDRTRMPLNHAEMITSGTQLCVDCYEKLVSFLLYWFRISVPKYLLPADASQREDCWYGYTCRTQHHNEEHRCRRNHVCRPTRGSNV